MVTIGVYQSLSNSAIYEHKCLENIKKFYKYDGNCKDQQQYNNIIEAAMIYTPEGFADNSPISPGQYVTVKSQVQKIALSIFQVLDVKQKTDVRRVGAAKSKRKEITTGSMLWSIITKRR